MDEKLFEKAEKIKKDLDELRKHREFLKDREHKNNVHFEIRQHYGSLSDYDIVRIPRKFNQAFLHLTEDCIKELEEELSKL